ncbi:MAG TPA: cation diffusion facilitator family transporter [Methanotrichaceae archaeon]|nr:cation diffusion facilitator family transporter [Methanotrichaceae archaeon]
MKPHLARSVERRFLLALALTALILIMEVVGSMLTGSLALLSDAAHVFLDIFALGISYLALRISALPTDDSHSYGFHRFEVVAALANGITLALVSAGIFIEAYHRFYAPEPVKSMELLAFAVVGLLVNLIVAFVLSGHIHEHEHGESNPGHASAQEDLNTKSAYLHVLGDAVSSVGVIVAAVVIWQTGWTLADPVASVLIGLIIIAGSSRVIRDSLHIIMEGVPRGISVSDVARAMSSVTGVVGIHDLHIWNICSGHAVLSAHVVLADQSLDQTHKVMEDLKRQLHEDFGIEHTTIQFECRSCPQGAAICNNIQT